ncbi:MAG TPA: hypothetical protein VN048_12760 [Verrucomicrobiae bacterium]|jgi:hypothetical protein|nr:hypothetical protein [Verrucomicrobiae bacterium]
MQDPESLRVQGRYDSQTHQQLREQAKHAGFYHTLLMGTLYQLNNSSPDY